MKFYNRTPIDFLCGRKGALKTVCRKSVQIAKI